MRFYEKIWYRRGFRLFAWLLLPFSALYCLVSSWRRRKWSALAKKYPVPVVVVGNLTVGGTGKTPFLVALGRYLMSHGVKVGVVSRGYKSLVSKKKNPVIVTDDMSVLDIGDEPCLIYRELLCPMVVHFNRTAAVEVLLTHFKVDVILSDDGLQHYALARNIEIVVVDAVRKFGNGFCLPAGPLREPCKRLETVDFVLFNQGGSLSMLPNAGLKTFNFGVIAEHLLRVDGTRTVVALSFLRGLVCHAVAGVGNPERFFDTLRALGAEIVPHVFSDHHDFKLKDFSKLQDLPIIMTQKDAVKCEGFQLENAYALEVGAILPSEFMRAFLDKLGYNHLKVN